MDKSKPFVPIIDKTKEYKEVFEMFDEEKNGSISINSLNDVLKALNKDVSPDELKEMLTEVDFEQKGIIEFEEFMLLMNKKGKEYDDDMRILDAFKVFEKENKKGLIEASELKKLLIFIGKTENEADDIVNQAEVNEEGFLNYEVLIRKMSSCL